MTFRKLKLSLIVLSFILFVVMSLLLGPTSFLVLAVCCHYGYKEYHSSRNLYEEKKKLLLQGMPRKEIREDTKLYIGFFKYVYLPFFLYCFLIYGLYHIGEQSEVVRNALWSYFEANKNFYWYSETLYKTIGRHYAVVATNNIFRAEMLVHIYAIVFNAMVLSPLVLIPSMKSWFLYSYQFIIRKYTKGFCFYGVVALFLGCVLLWWMYSYYFDAPHKQDSRRWSYHIFLDDKFLFYLIVISALGTLGVMSVISSGYAYAYALIHGSKKTIKTVGNKNE